MDTYTYTEVHTYTTHKYMHAHNPVNACMCAGQCKNMPIKVERKTRTDKTAEKLTIRRLPRAN